MKHEPEPEPGPGSTAFFSFAFHLIEALLVGNDHPGRMNRRMAEKLRELTGARLVVLARSRAGKKDGCSHEIAAVEPERRRSLAESPAIMAVAELTCNLRSPVLWEKGNGPPEAEAIMGGPELPGPILAAPLLLGEEHVGAVLLFSLPDKYSLDQVIDALGTLARVLAPVLRNVALYADQEAIIAARSKKLLESEERLAVLGELAGGVGHELRNPLGVITNAIYYLKMVLPESDIKIQEYLRLIDAEARNAAGIIAQLFDFARVQPPNRIPVEVSVLVAEVIAQHPLPENVTFSEELPGDLPPIYVDPDQVNRVLANLLSNACQAMPEGGRLTVTAELPPIPGSESAIFISIRDTGAGIASENIDKLFEPLFTTRPKGIGLGLAISKKLVEANSGQITVESQLGKGTVFTLNFPAYSAER